MRDLIISIFGVYEPVTSMVSVVDESGAVQIIESVASGMAGVDWPYVLGVFLFAIVLYSFFRLVGVVLGGFF